MQTIEKTKLISIRREENKLHVDLMVFDFDLKFTIIDGIAIRHAEKWLKDNHIKLRRWALIDSDDEDLKAINAKATGFFMERVSFQIWEC